MSHEPTYDGDVARELARFPLPQTTLADVPAWRSAFEAHFEAVRAGSAPAPTGVATEDRTVPSLTGDHAIPIRVYRPAAPGDGRGLVYLHAGSFVLDGLELEDARCRALARDAGCVVVAVDYRCAPEHPFPTPLDDCDAVLRWAFEHAAEVGVDPRRLGVGGCSAGGALAAGLAIRCRDRGGPAPAFQLLVHPVLDAVRDSPSIRALSDDDLRERDLMWRHYLNGARATAPVHASPASCEDLRGLPPAYVAAAEHDGLRDEAIAYAQRLLAAGVSTELHVWPRVPHAFELFAPDARVSHDAIAAQAAALVRLT